MKHINLRYHKIWPAFVRPKENELFSSWLTRTAHAHLLSTKHFCSLELPGLFLEGKDIDLSLRKSSERIIAAKSCLRYNLIKKLVLQKENTLSTLFNRTPLQKKGKVKGILSQINATHGLLFCPACLSKKDPYFRKNWRYNVSYICPEHKLFLLDKCSECGAPIQPEKVRIDPTDIPINKQITFCYKCRTPLSKSKKLMAPSNMVDAQKIINRHINAFFERRMKSAIYIERFLFIQNILTSKRKSSKTMVKWLRDKLKFSKSKTFLNSYYSKRVNMVLAVWLLKNWPSRISSLAGKLNLKILY